MRPAQVKRVIQEMRANGYIVRVKHLRPVLEDNPKHPRLLTAHAAAIAGLALDTNRGETHVSVYEETNPTVRIVHEVAKNNPGYKDRYNGHKRHHADPFRKDLGTAVALGRALDKLHQAGLLGNVRV